jgi:hypothetical protein
MIKTQPTTHLNWKIKVVFGNRLSDLEDPDPAYPSLPEMLCEGT